MVRDTAIRLGIDVDLKKATDPKSMALAGVMSTPGLAVDGKLAHAGGLPDQTRLEARLGT